LLFDPRPFALDVFCDPRPFALDVFCDLGERFLDDASVALEAGELREDGGLQAVLRKPVAVALRGAVLVAGTCSGWSRRSRCTGRCVRVPRCRRRRGRSGDSAPSSRSTRFSRASASAGCRPGRSRFVPEAWSSKAATIRQSSIASQKRSSRSRWVLSEVG
jgi:hypothetical protein